MGCPVCGRPLEVRVVGGVLVQACPQGHGLFLHEREVMQVVLAYTTNLPLPLPPVPPPHHPCPACGTPLDEQFFGGAPLWRCPRCGRIWLERHRFPQLQMMFRKVILRLP